MNQKYSISIAIPDSALSEETTKLDKTFKISQIARACAIFRIDTIYIYQDGENQEDRILLSTVLKYLDTPQFLRKRLFPKINELKYAGVLHPLKIPSHRTPADPKKIKKGDVREGIIILMKGKRYVDVGINHLIQYFGKEIPGRRVTVQFKSGLPDLVAKEISKNETPEYWGYNVKERTGLFQFLNSWKGKIIITSRKGQTLNDSTIKKMVETGPVLLVYGSPEKGVHEILGGSSNKIQNLRSFNFFNDQATETVRLEEAIIGSLSIMNHILATKGEQ